MLLSLPSASLSSSVCLSVSYVLHQSFISQSIFEHFAVANAKALIYISRSRPSDVSAPTTQRELEPMSDLEKQEDRQDQITFERMLTFLTTI